MRKSEYQKLALRTASPFVARALGAQSDYLMHSILGMQTEIGEIIEDKDNHANVTQEVGDVLWYIAIGLSAISFDMSDLSYTNKDIDDEYDHLTIHLAKAADVFKRHIYYGTEFNEDKFVKAIENIIAALHVICSGKIEECMELNIEKLLLRYPEKFDKDLAVNRNVKERRSYSMLKIIKRFFWRMVLCRVEEEIDLLLMKQHIDLGYYNHDEHHRYLKRKQRYQDTFL